MQMLHLATILLLSLSSNLDNIGVGVSYGIRKVNIPFTSNLLIAVVTRGGGKAQRESMKRGKLRCIIFGILSLLPYRIM